MKIELKNVKHAEFASHETNCFEATIYIDGKKAGHAENDGNGGSTFIHPHDCDQRIEAYAKTLPAIQFDGGNGKMLSIPQTGETLIDELLEAFLQEKQLKKLMKSYLLFQKPDGKIYNTTKLTAERIKKFCDSSVDGKVRIGVDSFDCLNAMPYAKALEVFRGANP